MAVTFARDGASILVGCDDRVVRALAVDGVKPNWQIVSSSLLKETGLIEGAFVNSPICMAFNADASQIGVSYRGFPLSVWATKEASLIGRCKRAKSFRADQAHPSASWFAVDRFTWNPVTGHIIGCYKDGCVFKWHPVSDENQEANAAADELAASSDGLLFATSDSNGTIKIWNFSFFTVVYQLSSSDLVTGLCFAPDCRRFYDLRGSFINVWEPATLARLAESEEVLSDSGSFDHLSAHVSQVSEAWIEEFEPVSVLAVHPSELLYCVGNEAGVITLYDKGGRMIREVVSLLNFMSISHIAWAPDGQHLVGADLSGDIVLRKILISKFSNVMADHEIQVLPGPKLDLEGHGVRQIIFDSASKLILIVTNASCHVWAIDEERILVSKKLKADIQRVWIQSPVHTDHIWAFGPDDMKIYQWPNCAEIALAPYGVERLRLDSHITVSAFEDMEDSIAQLSVWEENSATGSMKVAHKARVTQDGRQVLLEVMETALSGQIARRILLFEISSLHNIPGKDSPVPLAHLYIPEETRAKIEIPLGTLPGSRFVFLDHDLWITTYKLGSRHQDEALERQYFIPRDWMSTTSMDICCMLRDGTFLCPKDGEVAVIVSDVGVGKFDRQI